MFMTYDYETAQIAKKDENAPNIERFYNKDQNFSISWYPSLKDYYNKYLFQ